MMLLDALGRCDGVAHVETLRELDVPPWVAGAAVRTGLVMRPRRGWVASAAADVQLLAAVSAGGRLGCASQARRLGLWVQDDPGLHISLPRHSGHAQPPADAIAHWRGREWRRGHATADPLARARDRRRDLLLSARGYLVIRLDIAQIRGDWMLTLAVIRDLIARRQHLWSAAGIRSGG